MRVDPAPHPRAARPLIIQRLRERGSCFCGKPLGHLGFSEHVDEWLSRSSGETWYHDLYEVGEP